jgi:ATP-dependent protease ClpP protease subunit
MTFWFSVIHDPNTNVAHVQLSDDIGCGGQTSGQLAEELKRLEPSRVSVQIDSRGGCGRTGLNLANIFRHYDSHAQIVNAGMSAALIAALGCRTIRAHPNSKILIHSPAGYAFGPAEELLAAALDVEKLRGYVQELLLQKTEQPVEIVSRWLSRDTWFTSEEALAAGILDGIDEPTPEPAPQSDLAAVAFSTSPPLKSDEERAFWDWINAFGALEVENPERFRSELMQWAAFNLRQTNPQTDYGH